MKRLSPTHGFFDENLTPHLTYNRCTYHASHGIHEFKHAQELVLGDGNAFAGGRVEVVGLNGPAIQRRQTVRLSQ